MTSKTASFFRYKTEHRGSSNTTVSNNGILLHFNSQRVKKKQLQKNQIKLYLTTQEPLWSNKVFKILCLHTYFFHLNNIQ